MLLHRLQRFPNFKLALAQRLLETHSFQGPDMTKGMITYAFNSAKKINMDKKVNSFINSGHFYVNSNSIPIPFLSIPLPSPIPGIKSGIELNSHLIPELTPTLSATRNGFGDVK